MFSKNYIQNIEDDVDLTSKIFRDFNNLNIGKEIINSTFV